jgi:hypothetical protein
LFALIARVRICHGVVKSKGVPLTGMSCPVGIRPLFTGVMESAKIVSSWSRIVPSASPLKFEVVVLGQIDGRGLVGDRPVFDAPHVFGRQPVTDRDVEFAGIALVAIGAGHRELHADVSALGERLAVPNDRVETLGAAVKRAGNSRAGALLVGSEYVTPPRA